VLNHCTTPPVVHFTDGPEALDTDMLDMPPTRERTKKNAEVSSETKYVKKHRMVEKLVPDAQKVIQSILDTGVNIQLKTILSNMPDVRKKLFQTGYTAEEFERIGINAAHLEYDSSSDDDDSSVTA
jgi:hypothetical protein